ncbi:hypothetical protein [Spirosoma spitsbergense]|uniref:hypothetical protein n=1 Tax=Spirosoma spitsbergense TaxID=431554 RepID=UPI0012F9B2B0|nr:hypothetical protein [Spirosoma spitsbergense]
MAIFTAETPSLLRRILLLEQHAEQTSLRIKPVAAPWLSSSADSTSTALFTTLWGLLLAIPVGIYCLTIYKSAYNFPYEDDFNSSLSFVTDFIFGGLGLWGTHEIAWKDVTDRTLGRPYTKPDFSCVLDKKNLKPGHYTRWMYNQNR